MSPATHLKHLSQPKRDMLLGHIDGPCEINLHEQPQTRHSLVANGLLSYWSEFGSRLSPRPRYTRLTDEGRMVLAMMLAEWAEALIQSGCIETTPLAPEISMESIYARLLKKRGYGKVETVL